MIEPMYCPMSFSNIGATTCGPMNLDVDWHPMECNPNCAWAMSDGRIYWCGMVPTDSKSKLAKMNARLLENEE